MDNPKFEAAIEWIEDLFLNDVPCSISVSFGKDSSVNIALQAAFNAKAQCYPPSIVVITSDTQIENPEIQTHVMEESRRLLDYAEAKGLELDF